ncbi:hypothetical protein FA13DRAFT_1709364 [Coprinellus micaceus]|uniref:Uncharacterized protein n=1 Tax=Coprinellus micaceus TaxID=71717 RepID=A0A4Y7TCG8_COPMI|nr:hypothetical protein FA13DRAFT_1709364 [Coprinellus micaceus]
MVSTRSTLRRVPEGGSPDLIAGGATAASQPIATRAGTRTRRGRSESQTPSKSLHFPADNASPVSAGPSRTPKPTARKKKGPYSAVPPTSHRKTHSISTAFNGLGIEEALEAPELSRPFSSSLPHPPGKLKRSLGKRPVISPNRDGETPSSASIPEQELQSSLVGPRNEATDAIITPRRKGRPYKVNFNDIAPRTPPQPVHPTRVLTHTPPIELASKTGTTFRKVIRSDDDLMTLEAIAKRSLEREKTLQDYRPTRTSSNLYSLECSKNRMTTIATQAMSCLRSSCPWIWATLIREDAIPPPAQNGPVTLGPEGTHIILDHFALSCGGTWQRAPLEYPKEWVDAHNQGLARRDTDIIDE